MKLKKVGAICNASGRYYLMDQKNAVGEIVYQWLGDGIAAYPLEGLPYMDTENICAMLDITEKKRNKLIIRQIVSPKAINWEDTDTLERQIEEPKLCVRHEGRDLLPLETSAGITFIQEKYLAPLDNLEYMNLFERRNRDSSIYIVAKIGLVIQAVIMPMNLPNEDFMNLLDDLTRQCRDAMWKRTFAKEQDMPAGQEPGTLFQVDESTGEVLEETEGQE